MTAAEYVRELSEAMTDRYPDDCVTHACRIAELLNAEGRSPWIGALRDVSQLGDSIFHGPLVPQRFRATTWTTHYVACSGREVYDPLAGAPVDLDTFAQLVFGRPLAVEQHLDPAETARLLTSGDLRRHCRSGAAGFSPPERRQG